MQQAIGIFDSGYGGLTVFRSIAAALPQYDYIYLGDNARAPYGNRSFETVHEFTLQCVEWLWQQNCPLVILACNTASAKALRNIQQKDLPRIAPDKKVLGVIRPTAETIGDYTRSREIGILGTSGTVSSFSYPREIEKFFPDIKVYQQACPLWVPFVEGGEYDEAFVNRTIQDDLNHLLAQSDHIDTVLMACTHYPLLADKIKKFIPPQIQLIAQGDIVASSLIDYLRRHEEITMQLSTNAQRTFFTTGDPDDFERHGALFFGAEIQAKHTTVGNF